jgi:hypothetical protein
MRLHLPYQDNLSALIHDPSFKAVAGEAVFNKTRVINTLGNQAAVREIFMSGTGSLGPTEMAMWGGFVALEKSSITLRA